MSSASLVPVFLTPAASLLALGNHQCEATPVTLKTPMPDPSGKQNVPTPPAIHPLPALYLTPPPESELVPGSLTPVLSDVDDVDVDGMTCLKSVSMGTSIYEAASFLSGALNIISPPSLEASSGAWPDSFDSHLRHGLSPDTTSKPYAGL